MRRERQCEHEEEAARRRAELECVEKNAEFGSAINDMLSNMEALEERDLCWILAA